MRSELGDRREGLDFFGFFEFCKDLVFIRGKWGVIESFGVFVFIRCIFVFLFL